jgi:hypothetical protein
MTRTNGNGDSATAVHIALQGKGGVGKSLESTASGEKFRKLGSVLTRKNLTIRPAI